MNFVNRLLAVAVAVSGAIASSFIVPASAHEAPDALVKRITLETLDAAKADKEIQAGNHLRMRDLVDSRIVAPHFDILRMTQLATGRFWRNATAEQHQQVMNEFHSLITATYSSALFQSMGQKFEFKPMRSAEGDSDVEVRSQVVQARGEPIAFNYRLGKTDGRWKVFDVNVLGAWLVEAYKGTFASEIRKSGIDGLIKTLAEKNKSLSTKGR